MEEDVQVAQKKLLEELRKEKDARDSTDESSTRVSIGHAESSNNSNGSIAPGTDTSDRSTARREKRSGETNQSFEGHGERIRPANRQNINATQNISDNNTKNGQSINFQLRNPFKFKDTTKEPVKLFTDKEVLQERDRLIEVYYRGSSLLDDILEIVVKDHEPVQIWQLDQSEAEMLAELHLERATKNVESARSARQLLAIYDRLYFWILCGPRLKATGTHIKQHGGLSFK